MNKTIFFSLLLIISLISSIVFINYDISQQHHLNEASDNDSFMINAQYRQYDLSGQLHFMLNAKRMMHYRTHDTAYFTQPHLFGYTAEHIPWQVDAINGKTLKGTQQIYFWDHVILKQESYPRHPDTTTIQTNTMTVFPNQSLATTQDPVTILRPQSIAYGTGLNANLKTGMIQLLSQARGSYDPQKD